MRESAWSPTLRASSVMETTWICGAYSSGHGPARDHMVPRCQPSDHRCCLLDYSCIRCPPLRVDQLASNVGGNPNEPDREDHRGGTRGIEKRARRTQGQPCRRGRQTCPTRRSHRPPRKCHAPSVTGLDDPGHLLPYVCPTGSRLDNEGVRIRAAHPEPNR